MTTIQTVTGPIDSADLGRTLMHDGIPTVTDDDRSAALARLVEHGAGDRIVVSHDSVWCWKGNPWPPGLRDHVASLFVPTRFDTEIIPKLLNLGVSDAAVHHLTHTNPRQYFEGAPLAPLPHTEHSS